MIGISFFKYEASSITLTSSWYVAATVVTYVEAKTSHDYCTTTTFAPVTARDTGHGND